MSGNNKGLVLLPDKIENTTQTNNANIYSKDLKMTITGAVESLKDIQSDMQDIQVQNAWSKFWRKGKNIDTLTESVERQVLVQKLTLELIVLIMGASCKMTENYQEIEKAIDKQIKMNSNNVTVLKYIKHLKGMLDSINNRELKIEEIIRNVNLLSENMKILEESLNELEEDYNNKINSIEQDFHKKVDELEENHSKEILEYNKRIESLKENIDNLEIVINAGLEDSSNKISSIEQDFNEKVNEIEISYRKEVIEYTQKIESLEETIDSIVKEQSILKNKIKKSRGISLVSSIIALILVLLIIKLFLL